MTNNRFQSLIDRIQAELGSDYQLPCVLASSRMPDILERGIDDNTWLEPVECKAPVRPALWYSSLYGWEFV